MWWLSERPAGLTEDRRPRVWDEAQLDVTEGAV